MTAAHLTQSVLALPEAERLELARKIVESLASKEEQAAAIAEGVRRMEAIVTGQTPGLSEAQFRQARR
jgi:putative addiction module component (TIGR02574 family)